MKKQIMILSLMALMLMLNSVVALAVTVACDAQPSVVYSSAPRLQTQTGWTTPTTAAGTAPTTAAATMGADTCTGGACATVSALAQDCDDGTNTVLTGFFTLNSHAQTEDSSITGLLVTETLTDGTAVFNVGFFPGTNDGFISSYNPSTGTSTYQNVVDFPTCTQIGNLDGAVDVANSELIVAADCISAGEDGIITVRFDNTGAVDTARGIDIAGAGFTDLRLGQSGLSNDNIIINNEMAWSNDLTDSLYIAGRATGPAGQTVGVVQRINAATLANQNSFTALYAAPTTNIQYAGIGEANNKEASINGGAVAVGFADPNTGVSDDADGTAIVFQAAVIAQTTVSIASSDNAFNVATFGSVGDDDVAFGGTYESGTLIVVADATSGGLTDARTYSGGGPVINFGLNNDAQFVFASQSGTSTQAGLFDGDFSPLATSAVTLFDSTDATFDAATDNLLFPGMSFNNFAVAVANMGTTNNPVDLMNVYITNVNDQPAFNAIAPMFGAAGDEVAFSGVAGDIMLFAATTTGYTGTTPEFSLSTLLLTVLVAGGIMMFVIRKRYD